MKIAVFGTGYVGLVTGLCFAEKGHSVICADIDAAMIKRLRQGSSPIYEPGLESLIESNLKRKRISFTTDLKAAVAGSEVLFLGVGTPSLQDGSADLTALMSVVEIIAQGMTDAKLIVIKSTVPVGTTRRVYEAIRQTRQGLGQKLHFDVASNPEFLREGCAIEDTRNPQRIVIGVNSKWAQELLSELYSPFVRPGKSLIFMDPESSEMTKYAANCLLAAKISIMNEFSRLCEKVGADIKAVQLGIGADERIGPHHLQAGVGYGGSCLPKDVRALIQQGKNFSEKMEILEAVENANHRQRERFFRKIQDRCGSLKGKTIAIWGVSFKPGTDDIREAPAIDWIQIAAKEGALIQIYDVAASHNVEAFFRKNQPEIWPQIRICDGPVLAIRGAHVLVILTEWSDFQSQDFQEIKSKMAVPLIFDGRNIFEPKKLQDLGIEYHSVGRPGPSKV